MIMNKKVSTIFAMAALMGGVFCSSAYAETLKSFVDVETELADDDISGDVFLKVGGTGDGSQYLYSDWTDDTKKEVSYEVRFLNTDDNELSKETLNQYLWTVSKSTAPGREPIYSFTNKETGVILRVNETTHQIVKEAPKSDDAYETWFTANATTPTETYAKGGSTFSLAAENDWDLTWDEATEELTLVEGGTDVITIQKLLPGIEVSDPSALNKLYNSAGFNFELNDSNLSGVQNIFSGKRVVAIKVPGAGETGAEPIATVAGTTVYGKKGADGYGFPAGTYFITAGYVSNKTNPDYNQLVNCTFIAVDSDNNISGDADQQKAGVGFTLTEVSGKDLVLYYGSDDTKKAAGNQIAVQNAAFSVRESTTADGVYDLQVNARFVEASSAATQKEATLSISANRRDAAIHTVAPGNHFIFEFSESSAVQPSALLFKGDTAAVYNIQLYVANGADDSRNGKYLTTNSDVTRDFIAKGSVLADTATPAYQWVISAVDGTNITFTNRETGKTLTTQLFAEGNGIYSMQEYIPDGGRPSTYTYYNVTNEGNVEQGDENGSAAGGREFRFDYSTKIQLRPVATPATYAGYLNVDDKTLMTLSFGRDIAPTSNKLYPVYDEDNYNATPQINGGFADHLSSDVADAAQWQLVKSKGSNANHPVRYNYVYANGNLINTKNNGDVVYAYTYKLQLVNDGKVMEDKFLGINSPNASIVSEAAATEFFIQENVDGSVSLKEYTNVSATKNGRVSNASVLLNDYDKTEWTINDFEDEVGNDFALVSTNNLWSNANNVKTYLIEEAPAISLPAVEGHYSFVSEQGNYITMNEERDGLTVKEDSEAIYLYVTDEEEVVPSFYITKGVSSVEGQRMFMFHPQDSVDYYVGTGDYSKNYEWVKDEVTKAIFKSAAISESRDTLTTDIKGESTLVAQEASNTEKVEGGLDMFKMQIIEDPESDGLYVVRNVGTMEYLYSWNGMLGWSDKTNAMKFNITGAEAPTANEGVAATEVKIIATDGAINIKNAAGKNVVISTILGQIVANEVLTSDNATISVPAGIAIVSVDGEEAVKVSVK